MSQAKQTPMAFNNIKTMHLEIAQKQVIQVVCLGFFIAIFLHFKHLPIWVSSFIAFSLIWRLSQNMKLVPALPRWLIVPFVVAAGIGVFATYWTITGRDAGLALLSVMAAFKLLESQTQRDALIVVFLSYFLVVTHFLFSQSIFIAVYMLLTILFLTASLISINERNHVLSWKIRFKISATIITYSIPIMIILFFLVPRVPGPLWGLTSEQRGGVTGLSSHMSPGKISNLIQNNEVAFRVSFKGDIPAQRDLYWRGPVMSRFNGKTWFQTTHKPPERLTVNSNIKPYEYTITMEPNGKRWLLPLDLPVSSIADSTISADFELKSTKPLNDLKKYDLKSVVNATHGLNDSLEHLLFNSEYPEGKNQRSIAYAKQLRRQFPDDMTLVNHVLDQFRNQSYYYTLSPPLLGKNPVDEFLFESKRGFCEHYAGSFALLMRAAGIPSRIVTGYQGGELNEEGNYLIIRQSDAHAWTEIWIEDKGWIRIDPTAAVSPDRVEQSLEAALPDEDLSFRYQKKSPLISNLLLNWDNIQHQWNHWVLDYNQQKQSQFLKELGVGIKSTADMVIALVVLLTLVMLSYAAISIWKNRPEKLDDYEQLFLKLLKKTAKAGMPIKAHESPNEYLIRIKQEHPKLNNKLDNAIQLYVRIKYSASKNKKLLTEQLEHEIKQLHSLAKYHAEKAAS